MIREWSEAEGEMIHSGYPYGKTLCQTRGDSGL
jgi:hypothetical protein